MSGILYVVATPLGNLQDLSERAAQTLRAADLIACEDTRHTRKLLNHVGSTVPAVSYHEHNEASRAPQLVNRLKAGENIALVSDAGTPLLSDPGYRLVSLCRQQGVSVVPVPGPSALTAALSVAGLPTDRFIFLGFPAKRTGIRRQQIREADSAGVTMVFYVGPHDLNKFLADLSAELPGRRVFLIREMTKVFETSYYGRIEDVIAAVGAELTRGEYTMVIEAREPAKASKQSPLTAIDVPAYVQGLMEARGLTRKDAMREASEHLALPKRDVYSLCTTQKPAKAPTGDQDE